MLGAGATLGGRDGTLCQHFFKLGLAVYIHTCIFFHFPVDAEPRVWWVPPFAFQWASSVILKQGLLSLSPGPPANTSLRDFGQQSAVSSISLPLGMLGLSAHTRSRFPPRCLTLLIQRGYLASGEDFLLGCKCSRWSHSHNFNLKLQSHWT